MKWRYLFLLLVFVMSACSPGTPTVVDPALTPGAPVETPTTALPTPVIGKTSVPEARLAVETYLKAWQANQPEAMYALLSQAARSTIAVEDFTKLYTDLAAKLSLSGLDYDIYAADTSPNQATAAFRVIYHTALFKDLERQNQMRLNLEDGEWRIEWDDGLPLPELRGGNKLSLELEPGQRGQILDRNGQVLAGTDSATALGIVPGEISADQEGTMLDTLSALTGKVPFAIRQSYDNAGPNWYIPVGEASESTLDTRRELVNNLGGVRQFPYGPTRFYPWSGVAPHVVGYVQPIPAEQLQDYLRRGFRQDERVGTSGLEQWGDEILSTRSASLYLLNSNNEVMSRLAQVQADPPRDIVTTLDMRVQRQAQAAIREFNGAVVVLERDTGRVLAMVSSPGFDTNMFTPENFNSSALWERLSQNPNAPLVNRATGDQGSGYPLGSVFKIVDMAAALESGLFKPEDTYDCQYYFTEIIGRRYEDWTLKKEKPASGMLNLPEGLMRSCNPWFYHIGLTLFNQGHGKDIANMARGFGLGSPTGIGVIPESAGNVPEPSSEVQAVEQAIGQGELLVTPLQVANFVAAVGNGGTLYRTQLVEKLIGPGGSEEQVFKPEELGKLPVKPENLQIIQDAMRSVIVNKRGTAYDVLGAFRIPVYGKTGTAQTCDTCTSHAWFAAYTDAPTSDLPDISVAVICEFEGEGSEVAAPVARRVIEAYYFGKPVNLYPWEESIYVVRTETPTPLPNEENPTETPQP